jgi:hypothetical protein
MAKWEQTIKTIYCHFKLYILKDILQPINNWLPLNNLYNYINLKGLVVYRFNFPLKCNRKKIDYRIWLDYSLQCIFSSLFAIREHNYNKLYQKPKHQWQTSVLNLIGLEYAIAIIKINFGYDLSRVLWLSM